mmetsp:Transcript_104521/g.301316  ORF Transcript_104521/g.301316 Transcript_104521/m.301316 type:complete len:312 (+) Transcript_104521:64-999(+)
MRSYRGRNKQPGGFEGGHSTWPPCSSVGLLRRCCPPLLWRLFTFPVLVLVPVLALARGDLVSKLLEPLGKFLVLHDAPVFAERILHSLTIVPALDAVGACDRILLVERGEELPAQPPQLRREAGSHRRITRHLADRNPQRLVPYTVVVVLHVSGAAPLAARLVVVGLGVHERLNRDEHARDRLHWRPARPRPRAEDTEADLAVPIEVRIEPDRAAAGRHELDLRRLVRIVVRAVDHKPVEPALVRRIKRPRHQRVHDRRIVLVPEREDHRQRTLLHAAEVAPDAAAALERRVPVGQVRLVERVPRGRRGGR